MPSRPIPVSTLRYISTDVLTASQALFNLCNSSILLIVGMKSEFGIKCSSPGNKAPRSRIGQPTPIFLISNAS